METAVQATYPLLPLQQGMLYHHLRNPNSGNDLEQIICRLGRPVDREAMADAWRHVIARHDALRSRFRWHDTPQPMQEVVANADVPITHLDWRHLSPGEHDAHLEAWLSVDRTSGFDLSRLPLMRVACMSTTDTETVLVWSFPHVLLDGRSFPAVLHEVLRAYHELRDGCDVTAERERPAVRAYVDWLARQDTEAARVYWRGVLQGFSVPTPVIPRGQRESTPSYGWGRTQRRLPENLTMRLREFARRHDLTSATLLHGAWALLLGRTTGEADVVYGEARAARGGFGADAARMIGSFTTTLPVRVRLPDEVDVGVWLRGLRGQSLDARPHEHLTLSEVQRQSDVPAGTPLFNTLVMIDRADLATSLAQLDERWRAVQATLREQTGIPVTLYAYLEPTLQLQLTYDRAQLDDRTAERVLAMLEHLLLELSHDASRPLGLISTVSADELERMNAVNDTTISYRSDATVHQLFEEQVRRTPNANAVTFEGETLTYAQLDARADAFAARLRALGAQRGRLVGIALPRSSDMLAVVLATLKAGAAYVPLDPSYPRDRTDYMLSNSGAVVLVTTTAHQPSPPPNGVRVLCVDEAHPVAEESALPIEATNAAQPDDLAYVIYTSGSTGLPKGVMLRHFNVTNFFAGMNERVPTEPPGVWLAVTSLSFDISVLELLWTITRGFEVVIASEHAMVPGNSPQVPNDVPTPDFSLFYFASADGEKADYRLLLEGARFADEHDFEAIWTPERHFHEFGGLYPNPAVVSAAVAAVTKRLRIRAGSVVLPLHHPIRVAEEWALVDRLSGGRVDVSFAAGWQPNDFVLAPQNYTQRKALMFEQLEVVRRLWRGEHVAFPGAQGTDVLVRTLPRPVQPELRAWITTAGNEETYREAGRAGANVLTHLLGQSVEEVKAKVAAYHDAWREAGHAGRGRVTLMVHTFVGSDREQVRDIVRHPMKAYLASSVSLIRHFVWSFPAFRDHAGRPDADADAILKQLSAEDLDALLERAFQRYFETSGLFGTVDDCAVMARTLGEAGVDEIACLIDFGVAPDVVLSSLPLLNAVRERAKTPVERFLRMPELLERFGVTHLQCTPALARMMLSDPATRGRLGHLKCWLVGGEALPTALAREMRDVLNGEIINMYGPTETTIWSSTHRVTEPDGTLMNVPIGRPIANTQFHVLDQRGHPVPYGVEGELYIGGDGVAAGYLGRNDLTSARFVPQPHHPRQSTRLYRTGDRVRRWDDGTIEIMGRVDFQVKIRGYRVEPGEIEALLAERPEVQEAVVILREDTPGDARLVAYVTPRGLARPDTAALREHLNARLPEYMRPSHIEVLRALPLTPNKKVDRKALPAPTFQQATVELPTQKPTSSVEQRVAQVWQEVLGRPHVGLHENFFDLGGHSLLSVKLLVRMRAEFTERVQLTDLFTYTTVHRMADHLTRLLAGAADGGASIPTESADEQFQPRVPLSRLEARRAARLGLGQGDD